MLRQDFIKRAIDELARAVAALASGKRTPEEVLEVVRAAKRQLPLVPGMAGLLPAREWARLLPSRDAMLDLTRLLQYEARALQALGRYGQAVEASRRALSLLEEAEHEAQGEEKVDLKHE